MRFVVIAMIVVFHAPPEAIDTGLSGAVNRTHYALVDVAARAGVPMLTAMSGFFLFASNADRAAWALTKRKARTLLVPLLIWNIPVVVAVMVVQARGLGADGFTTPLWPPEAWNIADAVFGLSRPATNYPLSFLRDLFVLSLAAPLLGPLLRRAPVIVVAAAFAWFVFGPDTDIIIREEMLVAFCLGGAIAYRRSWLVRADRMGALCLGVFAAGCAGLAAVGVTDAKAIKTAALIGPILLWPGFAALPRGVIRRAAELAPASFFVFVAHAPVIAAGWIAWGAADLPPRGYWLAGPVFALSLLLVLYRALLPRLPRGLVGLALGGRFTPIGATSPHRRG